MNLRALMRAEGDIANIIVSACIWRRISLTSATHLRESYFEDAKAIRIY